MGLASDGARRATKSFAFCPYRTEASASAVGPLSRGSKSISASGAVDEPVHSPVADPPHCLGIESKRVVVHRLPSVHRARSGSVRTNEAMAASEL